MIDTFRFELISPERVLMSVDVERVIVPGNDGDFVVLAGHAPVVSTLRPGVLGVTVGSVRKYLFVKSGFVEVDPYRLTTFTEKAYDLEELSAATITDELKTAEAELTAAKDDSAKRMADALVSELKQLLARAA